MIYDPNSTIPQSHETRVRARGVRLSPDTTATFQVSTRSDFIAPDMSPVSTHNLEMAKNTSGWTDKDKRVASVLPVFTDWAKRDLAAIKLGTAIATHRAPTATMVKRNQQGPATRTRSKFAN